MLAGAAEMKILDKAQENASLIFKPFLENVSAKKIVLNFK
jgi:hypothetical protein